MTPPNDLDAATPTDVADSIFEPPGPGTWMVDHTHIAQSASPMARHFYGEGVPSGTAASFVRYGLPMKDVDIGSSLGWILFRMRVVGAPDKAEGTPPNAIIWLLSRVHPEFRRRNKIARRAIDDRLWLADTRRWETEIRPRLERELLEHQRIDLCGLDDASLADEVRDLLDLCIRGIQVHFELAPANFITVGRLVAITDRAGLPSGEILRLLGGSSPESAGCDEPLRRVAAELRRLDILPSTLAEVSSASTAAAEALAAYLERYGHRVVARSDCDTPTLIEQPDLVLASVLAALDHEGARATDATDRPEADELARELRDHLPAADHPAFDEALAEARRCFGLRDDNVGLTEFWPIGLLRRALLQCGRRAATSGRLADAELIFEVGPTELHELVTDGAAAPASAELIARRDRRRRHSAMRPPEFLGPELAEPPFAAMPAAIAEVAKAMYTGFSLAETPAPNPPLQGTGIGRVSFTGRALVGTDPCDLLDRVEPGHVLVCPFTTPAYNSVVPVLGALVTEEGGPLSHAALVANEFRLPAVIGAREACSTIADGDLVEIDPVAGTVRVVSAAVT